MNDFIKVMNNTTETENGALTNVSTFDLCLDWFFHGAALRGQDKDRIIDLFSKAFQQNQTTALRTLFYIRDCRGGQGERDIFRTCLQWLGNHETNYIREWLLKNLNLISQFGRWDDYLCLLDTKISEDVGIYLITRLINDENYLAKNQLLDISLCAKWMPSLTTNTESKRYAKKLIKIAKENRAIIDCNEEKYRKLLSKLRKAIKIVEHNLTEKDYESIDYEKIPSYAMMKYRAAFRRNDGLRYSIYTHNVMEGKAKINAKTLYPYDLVKNYMNGFGYFGNKNIDDTIEEQWKALPDYVPDINGIVVYDTSGSMSGLPMQVSTSLALYISERNKSTVWKNYCIPFSSKAVWKEIKGNSLLEKLQSIYTGDCSNTNLQSVFDLILGRATTFNIKPEDMPKNLIIITDMEFDNPYEDNWSKTNFKVIEEKYKQAGYEKPNLVWWNVNSRQTQTPITKDNNGNILLSGCSPAMLTVALSGEFDPVEAMNRIINQERYSSILY